MIPKSYGVNIRSTWNVCKTCRWLAPTLVVQLLSCGLFEPHGQQHVRLPCLSPSPRVYSNSYLLSQWCHPTISSSDAPFSFSSQFFPASRSFSMSWLFVPGGQRIGTSTSALVLWPLHWQIAVQYVQQGTGICVWHAGDLWTGHILRNMGQDPQMGFRESMNPRERSEKCVCVSHSVMSDSASLCGKCVCLHKCIFLFLGRILIVIRLKNLRTTNWVLPFILESRKHRVPGI